MWGFLRYRVCTVHRKGKASYWTYALRSSKRPHHYTSAAEICRPNANQALNDTKDGHHAFYLFLTRLMYKVRHGGYQS